MSDAISFEKVYTFADLERWEELRPGLPPSLAVLGHPVAHSVSPQMHNAALAELVKREPALADWKYFKFDIEPGQLEEALKLLLKMNFKGVNLTVPHKEVALLFVENLARGVDDIGIRAINTLEAAEADWKGHNTDVYGLDQALQHDLGFKLPGGDVVILGAGGAAQAAAIQCLLRGCARLWIGNRSAVRSSVLKGLLMELPTTNALHKAAFDQRSSPETEEAIHSFALQTPPVNEWPEDIVIINATTLGIKPGDSAPIDVWLLPKKARVFDMTFQRGGTTKFVSTARDRGLRAADGLSMLVWQGTRALRLWTGFNEQEEPPIAQIMMNAACQALDLPQRQLDQHVS